MLSGVELNAPFCGGRFAAQSSVADASFFSRGRKASQFQHAKVNAQTGAQEASAPSNRNAHPLTPFHTSTSTAAPSHNVGSRGCRGRTDRSCACCLRGASRIPGSEVAAPQAPKAPADNLEDALFGDDDEDEEEQVKPASRSSAPKDDDATQITANGADDDDERMTKTKASAATCADPGSNAWPRLRLSTPAGANGLAAPPRSTLFACSSVRPLISQWQPVRPRGSQDMDDAALRQLEYKEDEDEELQPDDNIEVAQLALRIYPCVTQGALARQDTPLPALRHHAL